MILCIGTTPAAQRVMLFGQFKLDQVNRAAHTLDGAAGKSINVAKVLQVLGAAPLATGFLGGPRGNELLEILRSRGVQAEFVGVRAPTRQCITVIDQSASVVTELVEESRPVEPGDYEHLLAIVARRASECEAMVLSGTVARGGPPDFYLRCAHLANAHGALCIADASGAALQELLGAGPALVKPNLPELEATVGRRLPDETSVLEAMRDLHGRGARRVVITAGAAPALAFDGAQTFRITSPSVRALNPIGSGDAFTAAAVWQLTRGANLAEACRWGAAAGAANALTLMAGEMALEDIERLLPKVEIESL